MNRNTPDSSEPEQWRQRDHWETPHNLLNAGQFRIEAVDKQRRTTGIAELLPSTGIRFQGGVMRRHLVNNVAFS